MLKEIREISVSKRFFDHFIYSSRTRNGRKKDLEPEISRISFNIILQCFRESYFPEKSLIKTL